MKIMFYYGLLKIVHKFMNVCYRMYVIECILKLIMSFGTVLILRSIN